jgi:hypothetical protein
MFRLDRYVAVLFWWQALTLAAQLPERSDDLWAGLPRLDHGIDKAPLGGDVGI